MKKSYARGFCLSFVTLCLSRKIEVGIKIIQEVLFLGKYVHKTKLPLTGLFVLDFLSASKRGLSVG